MDYFLTFIGKDVYNVLRNLTFPDKPILLSYETLRELLLSYIKCTNFECRERAKYHETILQNNQEVREFIIKLQKQATKCNFEGHLHVQLHGCLIAGINLSNLERGLIQMLKCSFLDARATCINYEIAWNWFSGIKNSTTLPSCNNPICTQDQSNRHLINDNVRSQENVENKLLKNYKAVNKGEHKFGICLSWIKLRSSNSCAFHHAICLKCGKMGHIETKCKTSVCLAVIWTSQGITTWSFTVC